MENSEDSKPKKTFKEQLRAAYIDSMTTAALLTNEAKTDEDNSLKDIKKGLLAVGAGIFNVAALPLIGNLGMGSNAAIYTFFGMTSLVTTFALGKAAAAVVKQHWADTKNGKASIVGAYAEKVNNVINKSEDPEYAGKFDECKSVEDAIHVSQEIDRDKLAKAGVSNDDIAFFVQDIDYDKCENIIEETKASTSNEEYLHCVESITNDNPLQEAGPAC